MKETYYLNNVLNQGDIDIGAPDDDNIAIGRPVFSSSASFPAEYVNDGNLATRWSSDFEEEQWIYVDLREHLKNRYYIFY